MVVSFVIASSSTFYIAGVFPYSNSKPSPCGIFEVPNFINVSSFKSASTPRRLIRNLSCFAFCVCHWRSIYENPILIQACDHGKVDMFEAFLGLEIPNSSLRLKVPVWIWWSSVVVRLQRFYVSYPPSYIEFYITLGLFC